MTKVLSMRLRNKVAIITGSGRGIGREMARLFAEQGARIVVADVDQANAEKTASQINALGREALAVHVDITSQEQVRALIDETLRRFARIDVLVNNAGVGSNCPFLSMSLEEWEQQLRVNLTGTFIVAQAAAQVMVRQNAGRIVNVASISGQRGGQGRAAYGASKAGVILLTKVMAVELAPLGIYVNAIAPGPVVTEMSVGTHTEATRRSYRDRIPLRRYGTEQEIAAAALFLGSDEAAFVTGHVLNVDGGFGAAGLMFDPLLDENGRASSPDLQDRLLPNGHSNGAAAYSTDHST
jgi:NAD(P)-dependent dehydrogenase (short-subunit alcohol dehydrogenase family)